MKTKAQMIPSQLDVELVAVATFDYMLKMFITVDEDELHSSTEKEGVEIFFFPDESNMKLKPPENIEAEAEEPEIDKPLEFEETHLGVPDEGEEAKPTNAQVAKDLGDPSASPKDSPRKSKRKKVSVWLYLLGLQIR